MWRRQKALKEIAELAKRFEAALEAERPDRFLDIFQFSQPVSAAVCSAWSARRFHGDYGLGVWASRA